MFIEVFDVLKDSLIIDGSPDFIRNDNKIILNSNIGYGDMYGRGT